MNSTTLNKIVMWYKVRELSEQSLNKTQIAKQTGLCRDTVRRYLKMTQEGFLKSQSYKRCYRKKLEPYKDFIRKELELFNFLSSPQIHDRLKERYADFPKVADRTVYSFVEAIRMEFNIPKEEEKIPRQMMQLPPCAYGEEAQVDFGEKQIKNADGHYVRVYFFVMVLCRSRYKYVYIQNQPFTTEATIYAHTLAFDYFKGMPKRIIYDQDKVLIHRENLGDLQLTSGFSVFQKQCGFELTFCRKADPQSKGKVENVVKYVKHNFLKGRIYKGIETLNEELLGWLDRTGNGKAHAATRLIPKEEFEIESGYLLPYQYKMIKPQATMRAMTIRRDNTIAYRGCFYSVPMGSYTKEGCKAYLDIKDYQLFIYNEIGGKLIASHKISPVQGKLVLNKDHRRDKSKTLKEFEALCLDLFDDDPLANEYFTQFKKQYDNRYYKDNLRLLLKRLPDYELNIRKSALLKCIDTGVYWAKILLEVATSLQVKRENVHKSTTLSNDSLSDMDWGKMEPSRSDLSTYNAIL